MNRDVKDLVTLLTLAPSDIGGPSYMQMLREREEAASVLEAKAEETARLVKERDVRNADAVRRVGEKSLAIARAEVAERERDALKLALSDPTAVHVDMLRGVIAKPSIDQIMHLYPEIRTERDALRMEVDRLREALVFYADVNKYPAPFTGGMGALWSDCGAVAKAALNHDGARGAEGMAGQEAPQEPADIGAVYQIAHDGFDGEVIGSYRTREGRDGVVLQQAGTRVVHVYGRKWLKK